MKDFIKLPILCKMKEYETLQNLGLCNDDEGLEYRMGFVRKSSIVAFYPMGNNLVMVETANSEFSTNLTVKDMIKLLENEQ